MNNKDSLTSLIDFINKNTSNSCSSSSSSSSFCLQEHKAFYLHKLLSYGNDCHIHMDIEVHKEHFQRQNSWPVYILYIIN